MEIPSKIYIRKIHLKNLTRNYYQLAANIPVGKKPFLMGEDDCVEYTNLSDKWHDAKVEKQPQGVCDNNSVLVIGLRNDRVAYKHLWADMDDCWKDLDLLTPPSKMAYDKVLVRNNDVETWIPTLFGFYDKEFENYVCMSEVFQHCIPYNEETAHLLGTSDEWKGDEG